MNPIEEIEAHEAHCEHDWLEQENMLGYSQGYDACLRCGKRRLHRPHA